MPFNINTFKATLDKYGGLSRNNIFEVQFDSPNASKWMPVGYDSSDLPFFCKTVTFPGIGFGVFDYRPTNIELPRSVPFAMNHDQLECIFMVDDAHKMLAYFHKWSQQIINYNVNGKINTNQLPYELGYKKDYIQTMTIRKYSKNPVVTYDTAGLPISATNDSYVCQLSEVFPVAIGSLSLSWDENDTFSVLPVSFSYSSIIYSGSEAATSIE